MSNITTRKLKVIPLNKDLSVNVEAYKFISDSTYAQYKALNRAMSFMMTTYYKYKQNIKCEGYKKEIKDFKYNAINPLFSDIEFGKGIDTLSAIRQKITSDFSTALKNGLASGERSINNYKRTFPLMTRGRNLTFYYGKNNEVLIKWVNGIIFKVVIGRNDKDRIELQHTLNKIINGEYKIGQSTIDSSKKKVLILNLNIDMGETKTITQKSTNTMGIDLGINIPAFCCISENTYSKKAFGSRDEFLKQREQFKCRRERLQKQLGLAKGGKGRKDKLSALNSFQDKERNWVKTYNHQLSKKIIEFAIKNNVAQINMEKLEKDGFNTKLLGKWSYYELQNMIDYKANREGIVVRYVKPEYTSQKCSRCGCIHKENRKSQEKFKCIECGFELNADHNASINIARSTEYVK